MSRTFFREVLGLKALAQAEGVFLHYSYITKRGLKWKRKQFWLV